MVKGQIARILSDTEVILNVGSLDMVKEGMEFVIFSEGDRVVDPASGKDLGVIETIKGRLRVTYVQEKFSRAQTKTYSTALASVAEDFYWNVSRIQSLRYPGTENRQEKLKIKKEDLRPLKEADSTVRVGDLVRSI